MSLELRVGGLSKTYSNGVRALDKVSLTIPTGLFGLGGWGRQRPWSTRPSYGVVARCSSRAIAWSKNRGLNPSLSRTPLMT